ncbi:DUF397 domain-containing protein [Sphaerisporangium rhizosphaerae]|uniref:DUF397 domain-containing protein n=1 Tax=Sphaerisporangium rhizosphaerae TaxID=2269375 RepID=A0ABW2NXA2_9ACTN
MTRELEEVTWRKSSWSGPDGGNCVEVAQFSGGRRGVRDSKNPLGPVLVCEGSAWEMFIDGLKEGARRTFCGGMG